MVAIGLSPPLKLLFHSMNGGINEKDFNTILPYNYIY